MAIDQIYLKYFAHAFISEDFIETCFSFDSKLIKHYGVGEKWVKLL